jgi:hypothetical protein
VISVVDRISAYNSRRSSTPTQFYDGNAVKLVASGTGNTANGTTVTFSTAAALPNLSANVLIQGNNVLIPAGNTIPFGAAGSKKFARLTADLKLGDTSASVEALPTTLTAGDVGYFSLLNTKTIPSGTLLGRTYAERDANTPFGAAVDTDDEFYILLFDVPDANAPGGDDCEVYRHALVVKENYLPDWATISANANLLAKLRASYTCIKGVD